MLRSRRFSRSEKFALCCEEVAWLRGICVVRSCVVRRLCCEEFVLHGVCIYRGVLL